jgi:hypothetical protein
MSTLRQLDGCIECRHREGMLPQCSVTSAENPACTHFRRRGEVKAVLYFGCCEAEMEQQEVDVSG